MIQFTIPGPPHDMTAQQKGLRAPRRGRVIFFTKPDIKAESGRIFVHAYNARPKSVGPLFTGPVILEATYVFPMTKEQIEDNAECISDNSLVVFKLSRPDIDNSAKLLIDVLTKCSFWKDDSQISDLILHKRAGSVPRIEVTITEAATPSLLGWLSNLLSSLARKCLP